MGRAARATRARPTLVETRLGRYSFLSSWCSDDLRPARPRASAKAPYTVNSISCLSLVYGTGTRLAQLRADARYISKEHLLI